MSLFGGRYTTIALRNAIVVSTADVDHGLTVDVGGVQYTAVAAGTGASCWSPRHSYAATAAPAVTDDLDLGYKVGSYWYDVTNDVAYVCLDATDGAAVWRQISISQLGTVTAGAWAGAVVAGTNVASAGTCTGSYLRVGARVFLWGNIASVDPTAGAPTATDFTVALPIASNFAATTDANGTACGTDFTGVVTGSVAGDVLVVTGQFRANTTTDVGITASYTIL
jgi:hypothetical protein